MPQKYNLGKRYGADAVVGQYGQYGQFGQEVSQEIISTRTFTLSDKTAIIFHNIELH